MPSKKRPCRARRAREAAQLVAETLQHLPGEACVSEVECDADEGPTVYREDWRTSSGENEVRCKLFSVSGASHTCSIMHEATSAVEVPDLPCTWPLEPPGHKEGCDGRCSIPRDPCALITLERHSPSTKQFGRREVLGDSKEKNSIPCGIFTTRGCEI